ncbi:MAG: UbiA family prenyltransferase, partial [Bdellovibrionales bacterium]|nr:UbiA family prenyltransferase [Bdellovibrionales bacterium]
MAATFSTRVSEFISLSKPRIGVLVAVTTTIGFYLARGRLSVLNSDGLPSYLPWISAVVGVLLTSAGAAALNNIIDRHADAKMERTKTRALPSGRVRPLSVWIFSFATILFGYALLVFQVNLLTANLSLATVLLYVLVYTPMKRVTWLNTYV